MPKRIHIIGGPGSGKTTLAKHLLNVIKSFQNLLLWIRRSRPKVEELFTQN